MRSARRQYLRSISSDRNSRLSYALFGKRKWMVVATLVAVVMVVIPIASAAYEYEIKRGETLFEIAQDHNVTLDDLALFNKIDNVDYVQAGQTIWIPDSYDIFLLNTHFKPVNTVKVQPPTAYDGQPNIEYSTAPPADAGSGNVFVTVPPMSGYPAGLPDYRYGQGAGYYPYPPVYPGYAPAPYWGPSYAPYPHNSGHYSYPHSYGRDYSSSGYSHGNYGAHDHNRYHEHHVYHTVTHSDTLPHIASKYGTTVEILRSVNHLSGDHIHYGQVLLIPTAYYGQGQHHYTHKTTTYVNTNAAAPSFPHTSTTTDENPTIDGERACARLSFKSGRDGYHGASEGTFIIQEVTGGTVAGWSTYAGAHISPWMNSVGITHPSVHVKVLFYPQYGGGPVEMKILNPAGDTSFGWLARGVCHAIEIEYPVQYGY